MAKQTLKPLYKKTEGEIPTGWNPKKIEQVIDAIDEGGTPPRANGDYFNGEIPWVIVKDIKRNIYKTKEYLSKEGLKNCNAKLWPKDTLILSFGATIGEVGIARIPITTKQGIAGIIPKEGETTIEYLYYLFQHYKNILMRFAHQTTLSEIRPPTIKELMFAFPPLPEQRKIASILSTVDDNIEKIDETIAKTEQLKKGLMQKLLTNGIGHTKFKKTEMGEIPKEWKIDKAKSVCVKVTDGTHDTPKPSEEGYFLVTSKNLKDGHIDFSGCYYISEEDYNEANERSLVDLYDVIFGMIGTIGNPVLVREEDLPFAIKNVGLFKTGKNYYLGRWLCYYFNSGHALRYMSKKLKRTSQQFVTLGFLRNFLVALPKDKERKKIVDILKCVDDKIQILKQKKEKLQFLKKGLMQVLLTGKVGVKVN